MDALAKLGWNKENMASPLPGMIKTMQAASSFVDTQYNNQIQWQKAQADTKESIARAGNIDSQTEYNRRALDARIQGLDIENKKGELANLLQENKVKVDSATLDDQIAKVKIGTQQEQEKLRHDQSYNPILEEEGRQKSTQAQILTDELSGQQKRDQDALNDLPMALADLPTDASDAAFEDKLVQFYKNHPAAATNPKTKAMIDARIKAIEGARSQLSSVQEANANATELLKMKATGDLPASTNIDELKKDPVLAHQKIAQGNVTRTQRTISQILGTMPTNVPPEMAKQVADLRQAQGRLGNILQSPDGMNQIINGGYSQYFDTNGNLNPELQGDVDALKAYNDERIKQGLAKRTTTTVTVTSPTGNVLHPSEIKVENVPMEQAAEVTRQMEESFKSPEEKAKEQAGVQTNKEVQLTNQVQDIYKNNPQIQELAKEAARTGDWSKVTEELKKNIKPTSSSTSAVNTETQAVTFNAPSQGTEAPVDIRSASFTPGRNGNRPDYIVLHSSDGNERGDINTLTRGNVSAHYYTTEDGRVHHFVPEDDTAWHGGKVIDSKFANSHTIGIEQEHVDGQPWKDAEVKATAKQVADIMNRKPWITLDHVVGHADIAGERKQDPLNFPWAKFRQYVQDFQQQSKAVASADVLDKRLGGQLADHGQDFINAGKKYNISPVLLASIASFETGRGTSEALREYNNVGGMMDSSTPDATGFRRFASIQESIDALAQKLRREYVDQGYDSLRKIAGRYAPPGAANDRRGTNSQWLPSVSRIMSEFTA